MLWGAGAVFCAVAACLTVASLGLAKAERLPTRVWIVYGGIAVPGVILGLLVILALVRGEGLLARATDAPAMRIEVQARMWAWEFSYPEGPSDRPSTNVLHLPAGRPVDLVVTSADVIHSFWIPRLGGKIDAIPGHTNVIRLQADRPGSYHGICAEFCGAGHTNMLFTVEARDAAAGDVR